MSIKKRWIIGISLLIFLVLSFLALLHFPKLFFEKQFNYNSFHVYANENMLLSKEVESVLDSVKSNLEESYFYNAGQSFHLFFIRGTFYEKGIRLFGRKNMASTFLQNQIYNAHPNFESGMLLRNNNEFERMNLIQIITHESVHNQILKRHSFLGMPTVPKWINEGYAEYNSFIPARKKETYDFVQTVNNLEQQRDSFWIKTAYNTWTPRNYVRDRLLMEYLIDVKGREMEEILNGTKLEVDQLYLEMKKYCEM